jgi:hypothetical protein
MLTSYSTHQASGLGVQEMSLRHVPLAGSGVIEVVDASPNDYIPIWVEVPLAVCCPVSYFSGLKPLLAYATLVYPVAQNALQASSLATPAHVYG